MMSKQLVMIMRVYPKTTGCLCANSHPGSYTGQDAYNDMLLTIERNNDEMDVCRKWSTASDVHAERNEYIGLYARSANSRGGGTDMNNASERKYVLRRLTPMECARLQGFPDNWCDGANGSDSEQYKLWGNGIALPCAVDVLGRIAEEMRKSDA